MPLAAQLGDQLGDPTTVAHHDHAVLEPAVTTLPLQPAPEHQPSEQQEDQPDRHRHRDEPARDLELEDVRDNGDRAEHPQRADGDGLELVGADAEDARLVAVGVGEHEQPGRGDHRGRRDRGLPADRGARVARAEAHRVGHGHRGQDQHDVEDHQADQVAALPVGARRAGPAAARRRAGRRPHGPNGGGAAGRTHVAGCPRRPSEPPPAASPSPVPECAGAAGNAHVRV